MDNKEKQQSTDDREVDDSDREDLKYRGEDSIDNSLTSTSTNPSLTRRLREIFVDSVGGDLLLQRSDRDDGFLQWLSALDMQVMGACRADERSKPLLKLNVSTAVAEGRLLAQLCQHFEPSEVGLLARCLCKPLVSIRAGKINKQGTLLSPTSLRGNLCLTLLPTSDLCITFDGDDGCLERLATLSTEAQCTAVEIKEISADKSGRSFVINISDGVVFYFWCSENSKVLGNELLQKMKDLLMRKPSLAELTGINESRLNCFAVHLQAYVTGSMVSSAQASDVLSTIPSLDESVDTSEFRYPQSSFNMQKSSRLRHYFSLGSKTSLIYQGSLSPRSSSFKDGQPKSLSSLRSVAREKFRRRGVTYASCVDNLTLASSSRVDPSSSNCFAKDKFLEANGTLPLPSLDLLDILGKSAELPVSGPILSPNYCWCPPVALTMQYTIGTSQLPISSTESLPLAPLSSLLSAVRTSSPLSSRTSVNLAEIPSLNFPTLSPEPLLRLPFTKAVSQKIPTFAPLICDPIVHTPIIDVFSPGQGYLVSASPAMSIAIPSLNPNLVDPLIPNAESMVEKSARETLRMLIRSSNQPYSQLPDVLPFVLTSSVGQQNVFAAGSRGYYSGTRDVDAAITNSMTTVGLVLLSEKPMGSGRIDKKYVGKYDLIEQKDKTSSSSGPSSFDERID